MFIVAGILILLIYALLVYYIGRSGWHLLKPPPHRMWKWAYSLVLAVVATSFITGRVFPGLTVLQVIGAYWMAVFYLLLFILPVTQLVLWLLRKTRRSGPGADKWAAWSLLLILIALIGFGTYNAYSPVVQRYTVTIDKGEGFRGAGQTEEVGDEIRIVMAADMHFSILSGSRHAQRMVEEINALQPDLVLYPGDIIDDDVRPFLDQGIDRILSDVRAPLGVYAALGNHDRTSGGIEAVVEALESSGMKVLVDETLVVADRLTLVGRKDYSDSTRAPLAELMQNINPQLPTILIDHQPMELDIAAAQGIDLMVSGHTHRGQIAPAHLITNLLFENDYGLLHKDTMHSIVTSGYGFWGPPIRLGSRSELVLITLQIR